MPLLEKCETWGSGPIGTLGDGCDDQLEIGVLVGSVVFVAAVLYVYRSVISFAGALLAATSLYHAIFGEGSLLDVIDNRDNTGHAIALAAFNTREFTVPMTVGVLSTVVTCCSSAPWFLRLVLYVYAFITTAMAPAAHSGDTDVAFLIYDLAGVAVGLTLLMCSPRDKNYALMKMSS